MTRNLVEITINTIQDYLYANMPTALSSVSTGRGDNKVSLPNIEKYFIYEPVAGLEAPAVFLVPEDVDFRKTIKKANHVNAMIRVNIAVVVEDINESEVSVKCWRYQSALHKCLDNVVLLSTNNEVKMIVIPMRANFTAMYTSANDHTIAQGVFRKMAVLDCEVQHYESF
jgi:hypothetical protein